MLHTVRDVSIRWMRQNGGEMTALHIYIEIVAARKHVYAVNAIDCADCIPGAQPNTDVQVASR
jgi:hypothetical protein